MVCKFFFYGELKGLRYKDREILVGITKPTFLYAISHQIYTDEHKKKWLSQTKESFEIGIYSQDCIKQLYCTISLEMICSPQSPQMSKESAWKSGFLFSAWRYWYMLCMLLKMDRYLPWVKKNIALQTWSKLAGRRFER